MRTDGQTDRQTDRHDEADSEFSQFCKCPWKENKGYELQDIGSFQDMRSFSFSEKSFYQSFTF